jgi:hypothetical protein
MKEEFAAADRSLFDTPIDQRLEATSRAKQHWLALVAHYHPTTQDRKRGNQEIMTKCYTRSHQQYNNVQRKMLQLPVQCNTNHHCTKADSIGHHSLSFYYISLYTFFLPPTHGCWKRKRKYTLQKSHLDG